MAVGLSFMAHIFLSKFAYIDEGVAVIDWDAGLVHGVREALEALIAVAEVQRTADNVDLAMPQGQ